MSWSKSYPNREAFEAEEDIGTAAMNAHTAEQMRAAYAAARNLLHSGVLVSAEQPASIYLSGHANEEHQPKDGWANDCVAITITQG